MAFREGLDGMERERERIFVSPPRTTVGQRIPNEVLIRIVAQCSLWHNGA